MHKTVRMFTVLKLDTIRKKKIATTGEWTV